MRPPRVVFFDLETGGFEPETRPIIQVAAIAVDQQFREVAHFEVKIRFDEQTATQEALETNHYDREVWDREAVSEEVAQARFSLFMKQHATVRMVSKRGNPYFIARLAGHNVATFDAPFIQFWYKKTGAFLPGHYKTLDTFQLASWAHHLDAPGEGPDGLSLVDLMAHHGVDRVGDAHEALSDVRGSAAIAPKLLAYIAKKHAQGEVLDVSMRATEGA